MATSNDITWKLDRDEIITAAYRKLGIPGEGNTLTAAQIADGAEALNSIVSLAVTDGMSLWKRTTVEVTPSATTQLYTTTGAVKVAQVLLTDSTSGTQYPLHSLSYYDYNSLPIDTVGVPVSYYAQPTIDGYSVQIWPRTSDTETVANKKINIVYQRKFDGFTATSDDLDFPAHWHLPIIYKTALVLAPENGIPLEDRKELRIETITYWKQAADYGDEDGSVYFVPGE